MSDLGIGSKLRKERELKGLSYAKVSEDLKIQVKFLEAFEREDFSNFPAEVYLKVFLKAYAEYLGIESAEIMNVYSQSKSSKHGQPTTRYAELEDISKVKREPKKRKQIEFVIPEQVKIGILGLAVVVFLVFAVMGIRSWYNLPQKPEPSVNEDYNNMPLMILAAEAADEVWLKVTVDTEGPKEYMLKKDMKKEWEAKDQIALDIGNKDGIKLTLNGKPVDIAKYKFRMDGSVIRDLTFKREEMKNAK